jgi:hypothetical protein
MVVLKKKFEDRLLPRFGGLSVLGAAPQVATHWRVKSPTPSQNIFRSSAAKSILPA